MTLLSLMTVKEIDMPSVRVRLFLAGTYALSVVVVLGDVFIWRP